MPSPKLLLAVLSCAAQVLALEKAVVYSEEPCKGQQQMVEPNSRCTLLSKALKKRASGAKVPQDVVCDFYSDDQCSAPLWIGMEDPGECSFSELEIKNKAVSVLCYDDSRSEV